jgi:hypothetical protein
VIDTQTQATLQEIVRRESRSLLSYIGDAFPWTTSAGTPALAVLRQVVDRESAAVNVLGRTLVRQKVPMPFLGSYPARFTSCNFIALEYLLPLLVQAQKEGIAALAADLHRVPAPEARAAVEALLAVKRQNLTALEELAAPRPASGVA